MKLRKLTRQLAAAAVAGAMALSLSMPALAEMWDMSNYEYGEYAWITVRRYADNDSYPEFGGQSLEILNCDIAGKKDNDPVFSGRFQRLGLVGHEGTTANATLQGAHVEDHADSVAVVDVYGNAELTLSGANTATHTHQKRSAVAIDDGYKLTITGSGSLTATAPATAVFVEGRSTLDVAGGTVSVSTTNTDGTGISAGGGTVQVSGGKLTATGGKYGIDAVNGGTVQVNSGTLDASGYASGINATNVQVTGGTLNASASEGDYSAAINVGNVTVKGGVLNVEKNQASYGLLASHLDVTDGTLAAKGQTVGVLSSMDISGGVVNAGKIMTNGNVDISGGRVNADTLDVQDPHCISLSGGNVTLKSVPVGTVVFSGRARLTIEDPVTETDISPLLMDFWNAPKGLYDTAYLKYKLVGEDDYVVLRGTEPDPNPEFAVDDIDIPDIGTAPAGDAGGAIAAAAIGSAAVWGGYEVATRVILHKLLPEGAAIPKTQAELALLLWNTAGQPEPVNVPAFADVDAATAKAAQWCTEQGYLSGTFKPEKRVAKYNVIRAWGKAFPKAK